jgi:hypothetical protein
MSEYSILRNTLKFESNFTQIPNAWLRDDRTGFRAKGILAYLMSHKSGWKTSLGHLAEVTADGKDAIRTAVNELEEAGYLIRRRLRNNGQLAGAEWELQDPFDTEPELESPMLENPTQENPMLGNPMQENPTVKNTNIQKTNIQENQFEEFWSIYPRKTGKGSAKTAYEKAIKSGKVTEVSLIVAVGRYANDPNLPEPQFIPHASTWLNQERWSDGALPDRKKPSSTSDNARAILEATMRMESEVRKEIGH